jgi:4-alpha-glucanotransferase
MKLCVWQFLPTGPTGYGDSPYQPLSTFAGNELLIDVGELIALGLLTDDETSELLSLPQDYVDYSALIPIKGRLLELAASRFEDKADPELKSACDDFINARDRRWLHDYALFRTLKSDHGDLPWPAWHAEYAHRDGSALRAFEKSNASRIQATKIVQFLFHQQWGRLRDYANQRGVQLFGDMPIYIALDSADAWVNRTLLRIGKTGQPDCVAGVPPDYFSEDGQLWGNPLYAWDNHAAENYNWWIERLRSAADLADIVRIDHFRGFESYWSVPADSETAREGTWEPGPGDAIFDAMQEALGSLPIVAEDLGVITPEVEALRNRHRIPGMKVLQFALADDNFDLSDVEEQCVCFTGTHDNDTTVGWYDGDRDSIHIEMILNAFSTRALLAIAPMQDYLGLGSEARINTPGTSGNNWRWRVREDQLDNGILDLVANLVSESGRAPQDSSVIDTSFSRIRTHSRGTLAD